MRDVDIIFKLLRKKYPGRKFFSDIHVTPYRVLISTILSQRTKDANTMKASEQLFRLADTPEKILKLNVKKLEKAIRPSGFYRVKAKNIQIVSKQLINDYGGKVPKSIDELLKLRGVGRKTANCVLLFGYRLLSLPVDTHVHHLSNRIGLVKTKTPEETELELRKSLPKKYWMPINELLVRHGQTICSPRNPKCGICPITRYCGHYNRQRL
ncbi:endonuclease III [Candidatus Woesearchaeota archaeon]|nr:endonuclease III [Candidatus Woesearchaeota archaeon]